MMSPRACTFAILTICLADAAGCGGATAEPTAPAIAPGAPASTPTMTGAELTSAVDPTTGEAAAPISADFPRETQQIYLLARLDGLPEGAEIEVRWIPPTSPEPLYVSHSNAVGSHALQAKLLAPSSGFAPGEYRVFVYVNGARLGSVPFRVGQAESRWTGVRELNVSTAVEVGSHKAIEPRSSFHAGAWKIFATFLVRTADPNPFVRVSWYRGEALLFANDLECGGDVRCFDVYETKKKITAGDYAVEVDVNGEMLARRTFAVGEEPIGPVLDRAALGVAAGKPTMPKSSKAVFKGGVRGLRCGVRLFALPEVAVVRVQWIALGDGGEALRGSSQSTVEGGGTRIAVLDWEPGEVIPAGSYKAVILLGERKLDELAFTVE
jgi:hypothetical protein